MFFFLQFLNRLCLYTCITWFGTVNAFNKSRETGNIGHTRHKTKTNKTKTQHKITCVGQHHTRTNTNNVNKTWTFPQTTGGDFDLNSNVQWKKNSIYLSVWSFSEQRQTFIIVICSEFFQDVCIICFKLGAFVIVW